MKNAILVFIVLLLATFTAAQNNSNAFTFGVGATGVQSFPGTDVYANYAVTKNFQLRYDNYQVPALNLSGNMAGGLYTLPTCSFLANTNLNCNVVQAYARAGVGVWTVATSSATSNFVGGGGGGGVNYSPADNGVMSVNLFDIQAYETPFGIKPIYSLQLNIGLGVNNSNPLAILKARDRAQKRLQKLQDKAAKIDQKKVKGYSPNQ